MHVLDERMRPVPVGVFGEVYIGGGGVAQGYWNRPDLTEQRFVRDPFSAEPGARLYRTGDVGRRRADGNLELAGRADDQVKVRGFRVELGEVEAAMTRHPGIAAAAAAVRRDESGRERLVGYLVPAGDRAPDLGELRAFLADIVPDPAVPSALVTLEALPMTPSGTLDRRALPAPARVERAAGRLVAPRTPAETVLAEIWAEVLGLAGDEVGVEDNFFALGGDSILGLQVVSRARRAGLRLTAKQIFRHQTVAELAAVAVIEDTPRPAALPVAGDVPATPIQRWFYEEFPGAPGHFNQSMFLELAADADAGALRTAFSAVLAHHDALRLRAERTAGGWRQHHAEAESGEVFRTVDLSGLDGPAQDRAMREAVGRAQRGLRPDTGPLIRAVFFTLGGDHAPRLFVTVHHLVMDGVSWRILLSDLVTAYEGAGLEAKSSSFRDWAVRLGEAAGAGRFDGELPYWTDVERDVTDSAPLPVDGTGDNTVGSARTVSVRLDAGTTQALLRDVPGVYRTQVNDVLLAALASVLSEWAGGDTVAVEMEGHGREDLFDDVDLSRTVGWFTTLFPVALAVPPTRDWGTVIKTVKERLRAVPSSGLGYGVLRHLGGALGAGRGCQVGFNYHGRFDMTTGDDGLLRRWLPSPVPDRGPDLPRQNLVEITGMVRQGRLEFEWEYSANLHREETIARLAERFAAALGQIAEHCALPGAGGRTPSDFPLAGLDQGGRGQARRRRPVGRGRLPADPDAERAAVPLARQARRRHLLHALRPRARRRHRPRRPRRGLAAGGRPYAHPAHRGRRRGRREAAPGRPPRRPASRGPPRLARAERGGAARAAAAALGRVRPAGARPRHPAVDAAAHRPAVGDHRAHPVVLAPHPAGRVELRRRAVGGVRGALRAHLRPRHHAEDPSSLPRLRAVAGRAGRERRGRLLEPGDGRVHRAHPAAVRPPPGAVAPVKGHGLPEPGAAAGARPAARTVRQGRPRDGEHPDPGRLGDGAVPVRRRAGRLLRHHRVRQAGRPARVRRDDRPVHQHPAGQGARGGRPRRAVVAAAHPGTAGGRAAVRVRVAGTGAPVERDPARRQPLRQRRGVRELPVRRRGGGQERPADP
ncbi:hypothetical protein B1L11_10795 [Microbispora sp. GKU 823]|nr:condensation domain-containing protein [Microbispora sp. GKU 823]OPG13065.1 hypothetical protein B1L11_10795 [Microbispora sp. GKU 823]